MEIIDRELGTMLADIRERRNILGMIAKCISAHSLPEEILCMIFECLVDFTDKDSYESSVKSLLAILRVCRRWYQIASAMASIWRAVDFDLIPYGSVSSWLARSASTPLAVWTSSADSIITIRDKYRSFPSQVVRLTLREEWYFSSEYRDFVTSSTFPNVVYLRIHDYPAPDNLFIPPALHGFTQLRILNVDCAHEFWVTDNSLPTSVEDLTLHLYGYDDISSLRLARALGSLTLLRRLVFSTAANIFSERGHRMRLPVLECVHLILNPHYHHILLDILPTFQARPYHLLVREVQEELYFDGPKEFASSMGAILHGHTSTFTGVRFTLGMKNPIMTLEGAEHISVSIEEHNPFGKRLTFILLLLDLSRIREAILTEECFDDPRYYDLGEAYSLLRSVECLVIEGEVGPEASRLLIGLGGEGRRFLFPQESSYALQWPALSSIHLHDVNAGLFKSSNCDAIRALGLAIWSIKSSGVPLHVVRVTKTTRNLPDFNQWAEFIPSVLIEYEDDDDVCPFIFDLIVVWTDHYVIRALCL